jgi:HSP20 family protein
MHNRLSNLFERPSLRREDETEWIGESEWSPMVDVAEDDKNYVVKVELPEMKREDIKVSLDQGVLSISGERKFEKKENGKKYHRVERAYGSFLRSFALPDDADASHVDAQYRDGVLTVNVAKSEKAKSRAVDVKVS